MLSLPLWLELALKSLGSKLPYITGCVHIPNLFICPESATTDLKSTLADLYWPYHDTECVDMRIGNKNGFPFVKVTCFLVEVTRFFLESDLQDGRSLMEPGRALQITFHFEKS